jgi:hypothetical protein
MLAMAAAAAISGASFSALAGACTTANISTYLSGGVNAGCTVLDKTITGVSVTFNSTDPINVGATVHPVTVANNPGLNFQFTELFSSFAPPPLTSTISFTVTAPSANPMTDASLAINGALNGSSDSSVNVSEALSNGKSLSAMVPSTTPPDTFVTVSSSTTFALTKSLTVTDTIPLVNSFLDHLTNQFSETPATVPEPSTLALFGIGLSALGLVRRRKRS